MIVSIGFLILLVLLGGAIANIADKLGRNLGKKRLSIGRLRPRHTAELMTTAAGAVTVLFTILILSVASSSFRRWVIEGNAAIEQRDKLAIEVRKLEGQRQDLTSRNEQAALELTQSNKSLGQVRKDLATLRQSTNALKTQVEGFRKSIQDYRSRLGRVRSEFLVASQALDATREDLTVVKGDLTKSRDDLRQVRGSYGILEGDYRDLNQRFLSLDKQNDDLEAARKNLTATIEGLNRDKEALQTSVESVRKEFETTIRENGTELARVNEELGKRKEELDQVQGELERNMRMLQMNIEASRLQPMIYRFGEEVARLPVDGQLNATAAENNLNSLLRMSRVMATERGAIGRSDAYPPAGIFPRIDPKTRASLSTEEIKRRVITSLAGQAEPQVLVAYSSINAFRGEPVSLDIVVYRNPIVYLEDQFIAESVIDGDKDDVTILRQLETFVTTKVRDRAKADRMIPRNGSDQPYGSVATDEILGLVRTIRTLGRKVRLQALADVDTRASDPLRVRFRIR